MNLTLLNTALKKKKWKVFKNIQNIQHKRVPHGLTLGSQLFIIGLHVNDLPLDINSNNVNIDLYAAGKSLCATANPRVM